jgi:hypothetical protein
VTRQTPAQIAIERERLAMILGHSIKAIQSARQDAVALHQQLEERLARCQQKSPRASVPQLLPRNSTRVYASSLRQVVFLKTAQALAVVSKQTKQGTGEFDRSSKQLTDSYRGAASDARRALDEIRGSIE